MPITELLEANAKKYPNEVSLVEINPDIQEKRRVTWRDYELIESSPMCHYRREITWHVFDEKANRFAQLLISRGIGKGDKVAILLMNCLEWLPIYFGILKTGALAVPLNFRYAPDEIEYCLNLAEVDVLVFGPEFIGRVEEIADKMKALLTEYNAKEEKAFADILDFHVKFERIHPFQDGNGRVGRLIMFKECLKYNIVPFIIEDNLKMFYYRGLKEWDNEKGYLTDTCLTAQDKYKAYLDYFRIRY